MNLPKIPLITQIVPNPNQSTIRFSNKLKYQTQTKQKPKKIEKFFSYFPSTLPFHLFVHPSMEDWVKKKRKTNIIIVIIIAPYMHTHTNSHKSTWESSQQSKINSWKPFCYPNIFSIFFSFFFFTYFFVVWFMGELYDISHHWISRTPSEKK